MRCPFHIVRAFVIAWVVEMPKVNDKAVFSLYFEDLAVEPYATSVIPDVTLELVRTAFQGYELIPVGTLLVAVCELD